jgi:ATP-binding cassette subfamily F protein 3
MLLSAEAAPATPAPRSAPQPPPRPDRTALAALRAEARAAEERIGKLSALRARIDEKLADPATWEGAGSAKAAELQRRYGDLVAEIAEAEARWLDAQERLEAAGA